MTAQTLPTLSPTKNAQFNNKLWLPALAVGLLGIVGMAVGFAKLYTPPTPFCQKVAKPFAHSQCNFAPSGSNSAQLTLAWLYPNTNAVLLNFDNLKKVSEQQNLTVQFAMNAGMYDDKYNPIGYTVIDGKTYHNLNLKQGGGNFHLMPNGVFWWDNHGYHVTESQAMATLLKTGTKPRFATQSGPMLVINGKIHPSFDPNSTSYKMRNGVGVCRDGTVKFVISDVPINFYQFAEVFKTQLQCDNALFLDGGRASALYSQDLKRHDKKYMGVMVAVTSDK